MGRGVLRRLQPPPSQRQHALVGGLWTVFFYLFLIFFTFLLYLFISFFLLNFFLLFLKNENKKKTKKKHNMYAVFDMGSTVCAEYTM